MLTEQETAQCVDICKQINATVHIRGSDIKPVVEFKDRQTRKILGGSEIKRRMASCPILPINAYS